MADHIDDLKLAVAWVTYRQLTNSPYNQNTRRCFYKFLGLDEDFRASEAPSSVPEETIRRIEWLIGPNAEVMYKIWKAQHEHEGKGAGRV